MKHIMGQTSCHTSTPARHKTNANYENLVYALQEKNFQFII